MPGGAWLRRIRQEADPGMPRDAVAYLAWLEGAVLHDAVVAGDPQSRTRNQRIVRPRPARPGIQGGAAGVEQIVPSAWVQALHARVGYRAGAFEIAAVRVLRPPFVTGRVHGTGIGRSGVQGVASGVVDPLVQDRCLGGGERGCGIAQAAARGRARLNVPRVEAACRDVDRLVVRRPGRVLDVERLGEPALVGVAAGEVAVAAVPLGRGPAGDAGRGRRQVQHEDLLPRQPAHRGEVSLDEIQGSAVAELLVEHPRRVRARAPARVAELVVARDVQVDEPVIDAGAGVQAGHVLVGRAVVDRGVVAAGDDGAAVARQRRDLAVGAVPETRDDGAGGGVDLGDVGAAVPPTAVNFPPMYACAQFPGLKVIELTTPLTLGSHEVTLYGAVALKLKTLFRV